MVWGVKWSGEWSRLGSGLGNEVVRVWGVEWSGERSGPGSGLGSGMVWGVKWSGSALGSGVLWEVEEAGRDTFVIVVNGTISGTRVRFTVSRPRLTISILIQKNFIMNNKCIQLKCVF